MVSHESGMNPDETYGLLVGPAVDQLELAVDKLDLDICSSVVEAEDLLWGLRKMRFKPDEYGLTRE